MKFGSCVFDDWLDLEVSKLEFSIFGVWITGFGIKVGSRCLHLDIWIPGF